MTEQISSFSKTTHYCYNIIHVYKGLCEDITDWNSGLSLSIFCSDKQNNEVIPRCSKTEQGSNAFPRISSYCTVYMLYSRHGVRDCSGVKSTVISNWVTVLVLGHPGDRAQSV